MKKIWSLILIVGMTLLVMSFKSSYNKLWSKVDNSIEKNHPETSLTLLSEIMDKAMKDKKNGIGQYLKAYTLSREISTSIGKTTSQADIKSLESLLAKTDDVAYQAILNLKLLESYSVFYMNNQYILQDRTDLAEIDESVTDIRLWSLKQFRDKVQHHFDAVLLNKEDLLKIKSFEYEPYIEKAQFGSIFNHDLYHVLLFNLINRIVITPDDVNISNPELVKLNLLLDAQKLYTGNKQAQVILELNLLTANASDYDKSLDALIDKYKDVDVVVEVVLAKALSMISKDIKLATDVVELCELYIQKYPKYARIDALRNVIVQIKAPSLSVNVNQNIYPNHSIINSITFRNLTSLELSLYAVSNQLEMPMDSLIDNSFVKKFTTLVKTEKRDNLSVENYQTNELTEVDFNTSSVGYYVLAVTSDNAIEPQYMLIRSSRIKSVVLATENAPLEVITVDAISGQPLQDISVSLVKAEKGAKPIVKVSDEFGRTQFEDVVGQSYLTVRNGADISLEKEVVYNYRYRQNDYKVNSRRLQGSIVSDRAIYRPGQEVFLKGYIYAQKETGEYEVVANHKTFVVITDASGVELSRVDVQTNDYGTFEVKYELPKSIITGSLGVSVDDISFKSLRVEEYKRPTFSININPVATEFTLGDKVVMSGDIDSFNGSLMKGAKLGIVVKYNNKVIPCIIRPIRVQDRIINHQELELSDGGKFEFEINLPEEAGSLNVEATVTTLGGETQKAFKYLWVSKTPIRVDGSLESNVEKDSKQRLYVRVSNQDDQPLKMEGEYLLSMKNTNKEYELTLQGKIQSNEFLEVDWSTLTSGEYKLTYQFIVKNDTITRESTFALFSLNDTTIPTSNQSWLFVKNDKFSQSTPAVFAYGINSDDAYVYFNYYTKDGLLLQESKVKNKSLEIYTVPYKDEYKNGLNLVIFYVKNKQLYTERVSLRKATEESSLQLSWKSFRDKIKPGSKEKWVMNVKPNQTSKSRVEVLALMYDASLDELSRNNNSLYVSRGVNIPYVRVLDYNHTSDLYIGFESKEINEIPNLEFDDFFNGGLSSFYGQNGYYFPNLGGVKPTIYIRGKSRLSRTVAAPVMEEVMVADYAGASPMESKSVKLRTNFNELAFFIPNLYPKANGDVSIEFETPEQLTKWKFQAIAHDLEMNVGELTNYVNTVKDFSVTANVPRFIRQGDVMLLASTVKNDTKVDQQVVVKFTLFNPETNKIYRVLSKRIQIRSNDEAVVSFPIDVVGIDKYIGCKVEASNAKYSDGEQHIIPILSAKELMIESSSAYLYNRGTFKMDIEQLFNNGSKTATDRKITVEFANDPIWFTLKPLTQIWNNDSKGALSTANKLFASFVGLQLNEKYGAYINKISDTNKYKLLANNEELKNVLVQETPWNLMAQNEKEELVGLKNLLNENATSHVIRALVYQLKDLQNNDGGWSWYEGLNGEVYTTTAVLKSLNAIRKFDESSVHAEVLDSMIKNGVHFVLNKKVEEQKRSKKNTLALSNIELDLLLITMSTKVDYAFSKDQQFIYNQLQALVPAVLSSSNIYQRATASLILNKQGNNKEVKDFVTSLRQSILVDKEGMAYFGGPLFDNLYRNNQIETHIAASIVLFENIRDEKLLNQMKTWLVMKIQRESISNPFVVMDIFNLLTNYPSSDQNIGRTAISIGKQVVILNEDMPYVKRTFTEKELENVYKVDILKENNSALWGGVYASYLEDVDQVEKYSSEIKVETKYFKEVYHGNRKQLIPISPNEYLSVGDVLVSRIEFELKENVDFLHLKQDRAGGLEPFETQSGPNFSMWLRGVQSIPSYVSVRDASTQYFMNSLKAGVYVIENRSYVVRKGSFHSGLVRLQSVYTPEISAHAGGVILEVK